MLYSLPFSFRKLSEVALLWHVTEPGVDCAIRGLVKRRELKIRHREACGEEGDGRARTTVRTVKRGDGNEVDD